MVIQSIRISDSTDRDLVSQGSCRSSLATKNAKKSHSKLLKHQVLRQNKMMKNFSQPKMSGKGAVIIVTDRNAFVNKEFNDTGSTASGAPEVLLNRY